MSNAEAQVVEPQAERVPEWTFGDRLRKAREDAHLDQATIAKMLGVSAGSVSNWEKGRGLPRGGEVKLAQRWSEATGVPVVWILGLHVKSEGFFFLVPPTSDQEQMVLPILEFAA